MCVPSNLAELNPPSPSHFNEPRGFVAQMDEMLRQKKCNCCHIWRCLSCYKQLKTSTDGLNYRCRDCCNDSDHRSNAKRRATDPDYVRRRNAQQNRYQKNRLKTDPAFALIMRARGQASRAFRGAQNEPGFFRHMPYTQAEYVSHLLSTLPDGYTEADACDGRKLHIDHIRPVSSFNLTGNVDDEFLACWALDNLQLLPAAENLAKRDSLNWGKR